MDLDLAAMRQRALQAQDPSPVPQETLVKRDHAFSVSYLSPEGVEYNASVVSRVPSFQIKAAMTRMEADLCGGRPWELFSAQRQGWMQAVARVSLQLADPPNWLLQWAQQDDDLLIQLYQQCVKHEALFFRADLFPGQGASARPRVVLDSRLPSGTDPTPRS